MHEEPLTLREYIPFVAFLVASAFVITALDYNYTPQSSVIVSQTAEKEAKSNKISIKKFPSPEGLKAQAYIVKVMGEKDALLELRPWKPLPPASLTKILTSLIAYEEIPPTEKIRFSKEARQVEEKISKVADGETFFKNDAIKFALMESANDAARALAEKVGRKFGGSNFEDSLDLFIKKMNERAEELGMQSSKFKNPTGLDKEGHLSTAEDLAKLAEYVWQKYPVLWEISRNISAKVFSEEGNQYTLANTNELLREFPAILGGKTGFTDEAKGTLLLLYPVRPKGVAVIVILKSEDRFEDGRKIIRWLEENYNTDK